MKSLLNAIEKFKIISIILSFAITPTVVLAESNAKVEIPVSCDYACEVKIEKESDNAPMPENDIISITSAGKEIPFIFKSVSLGTYVYRIYQYKNLDPSVNADKTVYEVTVSVTLNEKSEIETVITAKDKSTGEKPYKIHFTGNKIPTPPPGKTPEPKKPEFSEVNTGEGSNFNVVLPVLSIVAGILLAIFTKIHFSSEKGGK